MKQSRTISSIFFAIGCAVMIAFLLLPMLAVFLHLPLTGLWAELTSPLALQALQLSVATTFASLGLIILLGTPLAYFLCRGTFPGKGILEVLLQMPIVIPPAVAGVGLLLVFGRLGWVGNVFADLGVPIAFTSAAVVMAQSFVAAPFYIQAARAAFQSIDADLVSVSRTLGVSKTKTFFRVVVPLSLPGLITGAALSWGRALGEFGATIMFAGNLRGVTQTLPLAIYSGMQSDLGAAVAMSALLITVAFFLLLLVKLAELWPRFKKGGVDHAFVQHPKDAP
ncbi:MAG TPA: ABC transporter permease [Bacillales bacterium]|nr:ABC transporter permease [Bacillales bacterium]